MEIYFSEYFNVDPDALDNYGAFDICLMSDLPLFIDPFLLFNSDNPEYQSLHAGIIKYLQFLSRKASNKLTPGQLKQWYYFKEVKQNWFGFTVLGNDGRALGKEFADSLNQSLGKILDLSSEEGGGHLERVALMRGGVGRDGISDFTTNLIKHWLLEYTQEFARDYIDASKCDNFPVTRAEFNYQTETWQTKTYYLPKLGKDFVLLTPIDLLTKDDTWISHSDMIRNFDRLADAVGDDELRAAVNNYFSSRIGEDPTVEERNEVVQATINHFPELMDLYVTEREVQGDQAHDISSAKMETVKEVLVESVKEVIPDIKRNSNFYELPWTSYDEALSRTKAFKQYVEKQEGYKLINRKGSIPADEKEVQLYFGLIWCVTDFDVNREPNNGGGPVDYKISYGAGEKSLIEFKLAKSSSLKRNLQKQLEVYEAANKTHKSVKAVVCYTDEDVEKLNGVLKEIGLVGNESIVMIDARNTNKPTGSKA